MGIFDWIPTIPEVMNSTECLIAGHTWQAVRRNGVLVAYQCTNCGAIRQ